MIPDAFPSPGIVLNGHQQGAYSGMSLRDYFAAKAMQALITNNILYSEIAHKAYKMADTMLKARQ